MRASPRPRRTKCRSIDVVLFAQRIPLQTTGELSQGILMGNSHGEFSRGTGKTAVPEFQERKGVSDNGNLQPSNEWRHGELGHGDGDQHVDDGLESPNGDAPQRWPIGSAI